MEEMMNSGNARPRRWLTRILVLVAVVTAAPSVYAWLNRSTISAFFGPPTVQMAEVYPAEPTEATFDHVQFDRLLSAYVDDNGGVDYVALKQNQVPLMSYIELLASVPFEQLSRNERLTLLINAYNAFTLQLILENMPVKSIKDIPEQQRWSHVRWKVGSHTWSLNQIEHEQIRPKFKDPRIHFALVCAAVGCPPLRNEAFQSDRLEAQLEDQARQVHMDPRWFQYDKTKDRVKLTSLYKWYGGDFEQDAGTVLEFAARYSEPLRRRLAGSKLPLITWLHYDWSLNSRSNAS